MEHIRLLKLAEFGIWVELKMIREQYAKKLLGDLEYSKLVNEKESEQKELLKLIDIQENE